MDAHLTSFTNETAPFRAAIMESGQVSYTIGSSNSSDNEASFQSLAQKLNCTGDALTCVRAANATVIQNIIEVNSLEFPPVIDNYTYVADRAQVRESGNFAQVPTLIGTNADEGRVFELGQSDLSGFINMTFSAFGSDVVSQITAAFPTNGTLSGYDQISIITTLIVFQCGSSYLAAQNHNLSIPTWRYFYNATFPNFSPLNGLLRVYHGSEIPLVFQTYPGGPINPVSPINGTLQPVYLPPTPQQYALGQYMNAAWASFAKNPELGPGWGGVGTFNGTDVGVLGGTSGLVAGVEMVNSTVIDAQCAVFQSLFEIGSGVPL